MNTDSVCAVVVTYNRWELLKECLDALLRQSHALDRILVLDNASTDGTPKGLEGEGYLRRDTIHYIRLSKNLGGAGGFHEGLKLAYDERYEFIWLLDDDTIVADEALEALLNVRKRFPEEERPRMLASRVYWIDGKPHPMNDPGLKHGNDPTLAVAARYGLGSLRSATFVSLLLHRSLVTEFGLPLADYFLWSDDIEYTARILRQNFGALVPQSTALHKTGPQHTPLDAPPERFYYHVRNTLWTLLHSSAWTLPERRSQIIPLFLTIGAFLRRGHFSPPYLSAVGRGVVHGLFRRARR